MKGFIEIKPEYTVDRFTDRSAPTANRNSFSRIVNMIPGEGNVSTRFGISELAHTPDTTGTAWNPEDYSPGDPVYVDGDPVDYSIIQAIFPMNYSASMGDNLLNSQNIFSAANSIIQSGKCTVYLPQKVEGRASMIMTDNTAINTAAGEPPRPWGMRSLGPAWIPSWFPGKNSAVKSFLITYWIRPEHDNSNAEWHFNIGNDCNGGVPTIMLRHYDDDLQVHWIGSSGGTAKDYQASAAIAKDQWQFIAAWHDFQTGFSGLYHYNADTLVERYTAQETSPQAANHYYISSSVNTIGGRMYWDVTSGTYRTDLGQAYHGMMDYITMWSKPMHLNNSSNITLVRLLRNLAWVT